MSTTAAYTGSGQLNDAASHYEVQQQSDGQLLITTHPARVPIFTFDAAVIIVGFGFTTLVIDYFLIGAGDYLATLITTAIGAGLTWLCLKILRRERRKGLRPARFYVSEVSINIPPAPDSNDRMTMLQASNIDRLVIRSTITREETTNYGFGTIGAHGMAAKDRRTAWFADHSYILEAQSGGRAYVLASGLDETTANSLMKAVSRKLGF